MGAGSQGKEPRSLASTLNRHSDSRLYTYLTVAHELISIPTVIYASLVQILLKVHTFRTRVLRGRNQKNNPLIVYLVSQSMFTWDTNRNFAEHDEILLHFRRTERRKFGSLAKGFGFGMILPRVRASQRRQIDAQKGT